MYVCEYLMAEAKLPTCWAAAVHRTEKVEKRFFKTLLFILIACDPSHRTTCLREITYFCNIR